MSQCERHSIVWQECGGKGNSKIADRFFVPGYDGYLPFFICGDELTVFERKENMPLKEKHLLKGILYGLYEFDHDPKPWHRRQDRNTLLHLLDVLGNGFNCESPEKMILDVAASLREKNGSSASRIVLEVGKELVPQSSRIKSDLVCDLWELLTEQGEKNEVLEEILNLVPQVKLDGINADPREVICYYGLCAIVLLGREELVPAYLANYIYPNVTMSRLKHKIKALLENPKGMSPTDLKVI